MAANGSTLRRYAHVSIGLALAAALIGSATPGSARSRFVRVSQPRSIGSIWLYTTFKYDKRPQKLAQTFRSPGKRLELVSIAPEMQFTQGRKGRLSVYEVEGRIPKGKLLASEPLPPTHDWGFHPVRFSSPVPMKPNAKYSFVISARSKRSKIDVGNNAPNSYRDGGAYCFCRPDRARSYRAPHKWLKIPDVDYTFRLTFRRK